MSDKKKIEVKSRLHARNKNRERYDLEALVKVVPALKEHITINKYRVETVNFSDPEAVRHLNKALLHHYYGIENWDFPEENLCPPIPGRADYLHHIADIMAKSNHGNIPLGDKITCLDIGTGASAIYSILGVVEYDWNFIASDIDTQSLDSAKSIIEKNPILEGKIACRLQENAQHIFSGIIHETDKIDITVCNPPFHASMEEAQEGTRRKLKNLSGKKTTVPERNFAGISNELICEGGELKFIETMINESQKYAKNCFWFSTLVSKQSNLKAIIKMLEKASAKRINKVAMGTSNKATRLVAWTFLTKEEQDHWRDTKWK